MTAAKLKNVSEVVGWNERRSCCELLKRPCQETAAIGGRKENEGNLWKRQINGHGGQMIRNYVQGEVDREMKDEKEQGNDNNDDYI